MYLGILNVWNTTTHHWVSSYWCFEGICHPHLQRFKVNSSWTLQSKFLWYVMNHLPSNAVSHPRWPDSSVVLLLPHICLEHFSTLPQSLSTHAADSFLLGWVGVSGFIFPDILKKHTAFIFNVWGLQEGSKRFLEPSNKQEEGIVPFNMSRNTNPLTQHHIPGWHTP